MNKRTMDEMISYFNQEVSKMDISQENKMKLLGMITAIGYESKQQEIVRCKDCKHYRKIEDHSGICAVLAREEKMTDDWFCADGERRDPCS